MNSQSVMGSLHLSVSVNATEDGFCYVCPLIMLICHPACYSDIKDEGQVVADALPTGEGSMSHLQSGSAGTFCFFVCFWLT